MDHINFKSKKGEAVIEASLVYPIVFFIVGFIILFGLYEMQGVLEYSCAQYIASYTTRLITEPGYEYYGEVNDSDIDFKSVNKFSDDRSRFSAGIYRRINNNKVSKDKIKEKLEKVVNSSKLLKIDNTDCTVDFKRTLLNTTIVVTVKDSIEMPAFLKYIGLDNNWSRSVTATAVVTDPAEFIRNLDMAQDVVNYILDKLGISDKLEPLLEKVKNFYNDYIKP